MKRSRKIALTLLASACFMASGCGSDPETLQNFYANQNDCIEEWGEDECEFDIDSHHYRGPRHYYSHGKPWYYSKKSGHATEVRPSMGASRFSPGSNLSKAVSSSSFSSSKTTRGGFGFSSFSHSGGS